MKKQDIYNIDLRESTLNAPVTINLGGESFKKVSIIAEEINQTTSGSDPADTIPVDEDNPSTNVDGSSSGAGNIFLLIEKAWSDIQTVGTTIGNVLTFLTKPSNWGISLIIVGGISAVIIAGMMIFNHAHNISNMPICIYAQCNYNYN